jgi:hypothetical protein
MRFVWTLIIFLLALAITAPVLFFGVLIVAGPHSGLLPHFLEVIVLILGWITLIAFPAWIAQKVWRRLGPKNL